MISPFLSFQSLIILFTLISRFYQRPITINNNDISFIAPINPCTIITVLPIFFYIKSCIKKTNLIINMPERKTCRPTAYHKYISVIRYSTCRGAALINSSSSSARVKYYNIRTRASGWTRKRKSFSCYFCSTYLFVTFADAEPSSSSPSLPLEHAKKNKANANRHIVKTGNFFIGILHNYNCNIQPIQNMGLTLICQTK